MYPVVILETTKDERKKTDDYMVGLLINRASFELIDLLRRFETMFQENRNWL